jgi:hypothetical protein
MMQRLYPTDDHPVKARAVHHLAVASVSNGLLTQGLALAKEYQAMWVVAGRLGGSVAALGGCWPCLGGWASGAQPSMLVQRSRALHAQSETPCVAPRVLPLQSPVCERGLVGALGLA